MIPVFIETERLLLRELTEDDAPYILELDSEPEVMRYLPGTPIDTLDEAKDVIRYIRKQYAENGIGRWALVRREDQALLGWCGIKWIKDSSTNGRTNYYDIGYRLLPRYWNKGYAFEAAEACSKYAFGVMNLEELQATVMQGNIASARIAEKLGMQCTAQFTEEDRRWSWYTLKRENINP